MDKNIDNEWKEAVAKEKGAEPSGDTAHSFEANFSTLVSGMAMEAMIFLGEIQNPVTKKKEINLEHARYVIDTLELLKKKTKGNLSAEEANALDNILYELRTKYIEKNK